MKLGSAITIPRLIMSEYGSAAARRRDTKAIAEIPESRVSN